MKESHLTQTHPVAAASSRVAVSDVSPFQVGLLAYVKSNHPKVLEDIAAQGELSPELDGQIKDIMTKYTAEYSA